jgi:Dyp-type peroxidase family
MMAHTFMTIMIPVPGYKLSDVHCAINKLGNPFIQDVQDVFDAIGRIHFASLNALPASSGNGGYLLFELSCDGEPQTILKEIANRADGTLKEPFVQTGLYESYQELDTFLARYSHTIGQDGSSTLGLAFCGTPDMSVMQIHQERSLAHAITTILPTLSRHSSALAMLEEVRKQIFTGTQGDRFAWARDAHPTPVLDAATSWTRTNKIKAYTAIATKFLGLPIGLIIAIAAISFFVLDSWKLVLIIEGLLVAGMALGGYWLFRTFRKMEETDVPDDINPDAARMAEIQNMENRLAQNHLTLLTPLKPGWLRRFALRVVFYAIRQLAEKGAFRKGFLSDIGTIHFARWVLVPGTGDLLFFSNYGGSWESYLEDFISKAHEGLTGVWSNTRGFPRTEFLTQQGATDGDRFKRWARRYQLPTQAWYSAYGDLTTQNIRTNAEIRHGLATASTEDEARRWVHLFGSAPLPATLLETQEIQGLMFGGYKDLKEAKCLLFSLRQGVADARDWLKDMLPLISFGETPPSNQGAVLGFTAAGLKKLGLTEEGLRTFPTPFLQGMSTSYRARLLGDIDKNAPERWTWGQSNKDIDGVVLVYAKDGHALDMTKQRITEICAARAQCIQTIELENLGDLNDKEPFGFTDGISQPILRGTRRAAKTDESTHLVEPGEFILGYRDQRGYFPPSPHVAASQDPDNLLPLLPQAQEDSPVSVSTVAENPRDLGRNGSFLVLRQLEQDVTAFNEFLRDAVKQVRSQIGATMTEDKTKEWVAAKLIGRWQDGSSLVANPTMSASDAAKRRRQQPSESDERTPLAVSHPDKTEKSSSKDQAPTPDNEFLYHADDPSGLRCPFGAHIRRTNPRDSFGGNPTTALDINKRHRILRRGRVYKLNDGENPGLLFACLNADFERQFEFVQQTWMNNPRFHGLSGELDPLSSANGQGTFTIPTEHCPIKLTGLSDFVTVRGGGYFFMPGRRTLEYLSK